MRVAYYYRSETYCASKRSSFPRAIALTQVNESVDCRTLTGRQRVKETRAAYKELRGLKK